MAFFGLFKSQAEKERLSHIKNLIALSMADGIVQNNELAAIAAVAAREGVSPEKVKELLSKPEKTNLVVPESDDKKLQYLKDMVLLMMSDGDIDDNEMTLCKICAQAYGYKHEVIDVMLLDIIAEIKSKMQ